MKLFICVILFMFLHDAYSAMTEAQLKSTAKLMRNNCQTKSKVADAQIEGMHKGNWDDDQKTMCYMHCILKMLKLVTADGKLDRESFTNQVPNLPEPRRAPITKSMEACATASDKGTEPCESSYLFIKCLYFDDPSNYFFP